VAQQHLEISGKNKYLKNIFFIYLFLGFNSLSYAGELLQSKVDDIDDHYILHLEMRIDTDYDSVYSALLDFENLKDLSESIKESEVIESNDDVHIVRMRSEGCIFIFCQSITQVSTVTELGQGYIESIVIPERSDLIYGEILWQVIEEDETTKIIYDADIVPDFWIPPLLGTYLFKARLIEEAENMINEIEQMINDYDN
jgi:hypothetical protein